MKKSLIALAVMAAAGAASAQSSVTLFGIVDASLTWGRGTVADRFQMTDSGYNSSRLGFRGTEDLGGGMSASFWLEAGINNDDGTGDPTNVNNQVVGAFSPATGANAPVRAGTQGLTFNRRSTVSLGGRWGELRLGRDYVPHFWNLTVFDPFGTNGVGTTQTLNGVSVPNPLAAGTNLAIPSVAYPTQVRASNSIGYFLPANLGGFYGQIQYSEGETASNAADNGDGYGVRLGFASGPFNVAAAYGKTEFAAGDITTANIGGQWDFGMAKLLAHYNRDRLTTTIGSATGKGWLIGTLVPVGAGEIRAAYSTYELDVGGAEPRTRKLALGYVHNLSKRTAIYTSWARVRNDGGANSSLGGSATGVNSSSSGLDIGVRHSF